MTWISTRGLALFGVLGVAVPLLLLVGRILYAAWVDPVEPVVLALDTIVLGLGTIGVLVMLGLHLQSAVERPLAELQARIAGMTRGRFDQPSLPAGPQEVRRLARAVDELAAATESRLHEVTQRSGVVAMGTVLNGVAHEVSNPVAHMRLTNEILLKQARDRKDHDAVAGLERIGRGITRLEDVVKTLRQTGGRHGPYVPDRLVGAAIIVAQASLLSCSLDVALKASQRVCCVPGDIVQALVALLQNAGESGGKHLVVRTRDGDGHVAFEVEDDGRGLPEDIVQHAPTPFVTTKAGHAGLGLAQVSAAAHANGGIFEIETLPRGTRCTLMLPTEEADAARRAAWPFSRPPT